MTLHEQVQGWAAVGHKARQAIRDLIRLRLAHSQAQGAGNKSKRRAFKLGVML